MSVRRIVFGAFFLVGMLSGGWSVAAEPTDKAKQKIIKRMLADGRQAWDDKNIKLATAVFQRVLKEDEDNSEALYYMARLSLGKNYFKEGVDFFRQAIEASPDNAVLRLNLARVYEESKFYTLAVDEYKAVMELMPDASSLVFKEAQQHYRFSEKKHSERLDKISAYLETGKELYYASSFVAALDQFVDALGGYPTYAETYFFLGNIFLKQGDYGAGLKHLETSRWNAPNNVRVQLTLGRVYEEGRLFDDAEKEYRHIIKRFGERALESQEAKKRLAIIAKAREEAASNEEKIVVLLDEAKKLFAEGGSKLAEEKFKRVTELDIGRAEAYYYLGRIALDNNQYRRGGQYTELAVQYSPRNLGLILTLARIYDQGGMKANASKYYNRALFYADPESSQAKEAKKRLSLLGEGLEPQLLRVIDQAPDDVKARVQLAQVYMQSQRIDEAIAQLEAIVLIGSDDEIVASAHTNLAAVYSSYGKKFIASKRLADAVLLFNQAITHDTNNADAYYFLGVSYARLEQLDKAIESLQQATRLKPDHVVAYENLGLAYKLNKQYEQAMDAYSMAVAYDKNARTAMTNALRIPSILVEKYRSEERWDEAIGELVRLVDLLPTVPQNYIALMQLYADQKTFMKVTSYGEKLLKLLPKNLRIRMWVAQIYLQMSKSEAAKSHLLVVSRTAKDKDLREQAERILAQIERSRKLRFNYSLRYNFSTNGSLTQPLPDLPSSSNLSFSIGSGFVIKGARFNLTLAPRYSVNHRSQTDSFNVGFTATSSFSPHYKLPLTVGYSYSESGALLTEVKNSFSQTLFVSPRAFPLKVPKKFWLLDDGVLDRDKEHVTLTLSVQASYTDQDLFSGQSIFLMRTLSLNTALRQSYRSFAGRSGSFRISYLYSENRNKSVFGRDLALKKNQLQLAINQRLFFAVSGGLSYRVSFDNHINQDSDFGEHRRMLLQTASASLSRRLFKELSASIAYSWSKQSSNLGRGFMRADNGQIIANQPGTFGSRAASTNASWSSSINFNFRF